MCSSLDQWINTRREMLYSTKICSKNSKNLFFNQSKCFVRNHESGERKRTPIKKNHLHILTFHDKKFRTKKHFSYTKGEVYILFDTFFLESVVIMRKISAYS